MFRLNRDAGWGVKMQEKLDRLEVLEMYIILLLGVLDRPIPSKEHLHKELFVLSRSNPKVGEILSFEKHYKGPYSPDVAEIMRSPLYYREAFYFDKKGRCHLTDEGRKIYENIVREYGKNEKFQAFLAAMKMIRELYERLSVDELLFLIYISYPEYREKSLFFEKLLSRKRELAESLWKKGLITEKRFKEIVGNDNSSK